MKYPIDLSEWRFDKNVPDSGRTALIHIHWAYPDIEALLHLSPPERIAAIDLDHQQKLQQLIATGWFDKYEVVGSKQRPTGIKSRLPLSKLNDVHDIDVVNSISFLQVDHAVKIKRKPRPVAQFYCVKMTVAIEVEGHSKGIQTIEDRFVMIKAHSHDEAYEKVEAQKVAYGMPYLNTDGALVRWVIESYDDCYQTDIYSAKDLNDPEGVEVYSKLRGRRYRKPDNGN